MHALAAIMFRVSLVLAGGFVADIFIQPAKPSSTPRPATCSSSSRTSSTAGTRYPERFLIDKASEEIATRIAAHP